MHVRLLRLHLSVLKHVHIILTSASFAFALTFFALPLALTEGIAAVYTLAFAFFASALISVATRDSDFDLNLVFLFRLLCRTQRKALLLDLRKVLLQRQSVPMVRCKLRLVRIVELYSMKET